MTPHDANGDGGMTDASTRERHDWGPWVLIPPDGQPYLQPLQDPTRRYRPRLKAPYHPTLRATQGSIASEGKYFDLDDFIDAPKVVRRLARIAELTADNGALAGFLHAAADCLGWWTATDAADFGGWYSTDDDTHPVNLAHAYGWDRQPPAEYDWDEPERDPWGRPSDWGPWHLDDAAMLLRANDATSDLYGCLTASAIVRHLLTIAPTLDSLALGGLIRAIDEVLRPASWRRPFGADRGIDINGVAERVDSYIAFHARDRAQPSQRAEELDRVTVSPYEAARRIAAWEPTAIRAVIAREIPSVRVGDSVRIRMDDVQRWAAQPGIDLSTPAEHAAWIDEYRQQREGEDACARATLAFLTTAAPWTGTQADLHAAITPDPAPPGWPLATQLINILSRQYLPRTVRSRAAPRATYGIDQVGKSKGRNVYCISLTRTKR